MITLLCEKAKLNFANPSFTGQYRPGGRAKLKRVLKQLIKLGGKRKFTLRAADVILLSADLTMFQDKFGYYKPTFFRGPLSAAVLAAT